MEIYPAIDLKDGKCVRLLHGDFDTVHTVADDPVAVSVSYRIAGAKVIHVVDLDGAKDGVRRNSDLIKTICRAADPVLVELGGGLRSFEDIEEAENLGVWRFVLGSAATSDPEFAKAAVARYGGRVAIGIDAKDGFVRTHGWTRQSELNEIEFAKTVHSWGVKTIIHTDISKDGALAGPSFERLAALREALPEVNLVASGGLTTLEDVRKLKIMKIDAAIAGKALYTGDLSLEKALFWARLGHLFEKNEIIPAIIQSADDYSVLMLGYMSPESLIQTISTKRVTFFSRSRQTLWTKGETSGNFLDMVSITADCDNDTLLILARPHGAVCHTGAENCFFNGIYPYSY